MRWCRLFLIVVQAVLLLSHTPLYTVAKQQACVVSHDSILVPWVWPQVLVTSWVPVGGNATEPVLQFKVDFGATEEQNDSYGILQLHSNNITVWSERNDSISFFSPISVGPDELQDAGAGDEGGRGAWLNVTLEVTDEITLKRTDTDEVLFSGQPRRKDVGVKDVVITGSNITINCESDRLIWRIFGRREVVPLTPGGRGWHLGIFTSSFVLPSITVEGVNVTLGLTVKGLDANTSDPLQPFTRYKFLIECFATSAPSSDTGFTCFFKSGGRVLKKVGVASMPRSLAVSGESTKPFYLIQNMMPLPMLAPSVSTTQHPVQTRTSTSKTAGGGRGGGGSSGGHVKIGWSGWWAALAVILAFLLIFVIIMCFVSHYHRPKIEKLDPIWYTRKMSKRYLETMNLISEVSQENLESSPVPERRPLLARSHSVVVDMEDPKTTAPLRLWNAVSSGEVEEVEQVLTAMTPDPKMMLDGWETSPLEEAHRRGYHHVLKVLEAFMDREPQLPDNDMIISVMQSHARNVEAVFEAARGGQYRHGGGVDVLLRSFGLPGTVHDQHGMSLLHYAASVKLADGGPLWLAPDIRSLVENHNVFVNAVDYKGHTALHALAEKASTSDQNTCWNGKAVNVGQAWVNLATLLMKLGCDSRLPDNTNRCPDDLARTNGNDPLADELANEREILGAFDYSKCLLRFKEFLEASKAGQVNRMQELLKEGVSVLPLGTRSDPLQEAIQGGHRDAVFLLLSAGAPLCAHGLIGDTPYEAAHNTPGLPALFPALIRRALCGQLEAEVHVMRGSNKILEPLKKGSKEIKTIIERAGHKLGSELRRWMDQHPVDSLDVFNEMLSTSASLGLTLICQLLGVAGIRINPLPIEKHPLLHALENSQHSTAYSLCRDLKLNPYCFDGADDLITGCLRNDLFQSELMTFEKKLQKAALDEVTVGNLMNDAKGISSDGCVKNPSKILLYLLAELSLITLLHRIRKVCDDSFLDSVVHEASGSSMLLIAASYGRISMVEYLLSAGVDHSRKTSGGLTAPHLAAARGHKKCMNYVMDYTKHQEKWNVRVLPQHLLGDFNENIKSYHLDVLSPADLDAITTARDDFSKAQITITSRCERTGINSEKSLREVMVKEQKVIKELMSDEFIIAMECDVCDFLHEIMSVDKRFKGTIATRNPVFEKTEFFLPETFEFFCELEDYHALHEGCISLGKCQRTYMDGAFLDSIKSTKEQELFSDSNFKGAFYKAAKQALLNFTFKTLAIVPPFLHHSTTGISLFGLPKKKSRINLVQLLISPVLKVPCYPDPILHKRYENQIQFSSHEHLANVEDKKWVYLSNFTFKSVLSALTEDEQMVLWTCLYFSKLLSACWWLPKKQHRRVGCAWQLHSLGVEFPTPRSLISYFIDELAETKECHWRKENYLEKVLSILKRASLLGVRKVSFRTDASNSVPLNSVSAVTSFLEKIKVKSDNEVLEDKSNLPRKLGVFGNTNNAISKTSLNIELE